MMNQKSGGASMEGFLHRIYGDPSVFATMLGRQTTRKTGRSSEQEGLSYGLYNLDRRRPRWFGETVKIDQLEVS